MIDERFERGPAQILDSHQLYRAIPMPDTGDSLEESALHRIVEICDEYEVDWRANSAPKLEAFLEKIEPASRESLFHALVAIDVELRLERGEKPLAQDYFARFPDRAAEIQRTFQVRWAGRAPSNRIHGDDSLEIPGRAPIASFVNGLASTIDEVRAATCSRRGWAVTFPPPYWAAAASAPFTLLSTKS